MVPDVVAHDRLETGEHRGGMVYGVWDFASKLTGAFGVFLAAWVLQLSGYVAGVEQTIQALLGIGLCVGPVPMLEKLEAMEA
jgi:Na+/melibiose symporter-like transporter